MEDNSTEHNTGFKKLAVQWLNEHLCSVSSALLADSFRLRNRQLLKPTKRQTLMETMLTQNKLQTIAAQDLFISQLYL